MESFTLKVYSEEYEYYVVEQQGRAKGTRFKAYGNFDGKFIEAQASSIPSAMRELKKKVEILLDY